MKELDDFQKIKSLEHRMDNPMTLLEADAFNADMLRKEEEQKNENYQFSEGEMYGYFLLKKEKTGLPVDLLADDSSVYKKYHHPLWLLIFNSYDRSGDVMPMAVDAYGNINGTYDLNISYDDIRKVREFMHKNMSNLKAVADEQMESYDFIDSMDVVPYRMAESVERIDEMSKFSSKLTNLTTDIWVDGAWCARNGNRHAKRIKFKAEQGVDDMDKWPAMVIEGGTYEIFNLPTKCFVKNKDLQMIADFVELNYELIMALYRGDIDMSEFKRDMKKYIKPTKNTQN